jgi:hypothetical protein
VSGPPHLTAEQQQKAASLPVYPPEKTPSRAYKLLKVVTAADCSGAALGGRYGAMRSKAIEALRAKFVAADADTIIGVRCEAAPFLNNCWAAQKCSGRAVTFTDHSTAVE